MQWHVEDLPTYVAVVEQQGIAAAAHHLGVPNATVTASLGRLEQGLGLRLIDQTARTLSVTEAGQTFYRQALLITAQLREADAVMSGLGPAASGRLTVALPPAFCQELLAPALPDFRRDHPEVELELIVTSQSVDMARDQVDVAVSVGPQQDPDLTSRLLISGPLIWVTSPDYLARNDLGRTVPDLLRHVQFCDSRYGLRRMPATLGADRIEIDLSSGITHVNDPLAVRRAVMEGGGLSPLPELYCRAPLRSGELVEVFPHIRFDPTAAQLSAVHASHSPIPPGTRAFLDLLDRICNTQG